MERQRWNAVRRLALVIGLASVMVALLLWWADGRAPSDAAAHAPESFDVGSLTEPFVATRYGDVSAAWGVTHPVTAWVSDGDFVWHISDYGVTVTFFTNSFNWELGAVFTFTPQTEPEFSPPLIGTPYFFRLYGTYKSYPGSEGGEVSLGGNGIRVEMAYDPDGIFGIQEHSLRVFHYAWGEWWDEGATIDLATDRVWWRTRRLGKFRMGGYGARLFLPMVPRSAMAARSP